MIEFPSVTDVLVRPAAPGEEPAFNACFMDGTWNLYATGYQAAATRLYDWIATSRSEQDTLVYPFVFNWRMVAELRLKELVWLGRFITDRPRLTKWSHSLDVLWKEARALLEEIEPHESFPAVESVILQLAVLDPDSQRSRYPIHKKDGASFPVGTPNLSLQNFHAVMLKLAAFFDAASGHLDQIAGWKQDQMGDHG